MSVIPYRNIKVRSSPIPKAKPEYFVESIPAVSKTFGLTMPHPPHSIQPSDRQVLQSFRFLVSPLQTKHFKSNSALGSVKGKYDGLNLVSMPVPNILCAK